MKRLSRPAWLRLTILAAGLLGGGGGCGPDRQMVFTAPRSKPIVVEAPNRARVQDPANRRTPPVNEPLPASNGIDVPMVEQD